MAKPKAQTLQQRFGFMDEDLKTPAHDGMLLWLNENAPAIVKELFWSPTWTPEEIEPWVQHTQVAMEKARQEYQSGYDASKQKDGYPSISKKKPEDYLALLFDLDQWPGLGTPPPRPDISIISQNWEQPVKSRDYIIGFIDLEVVCQGANLWVSQLQQSGASEWKLSPGDPATLPAWQIGKGTERRICFEVKTEIPSLGELIRQINMYREYHQGRFVVVSPDDSFTEVLKSQGISFYQYVSPLIARRKGLTR